MAIIKGSTIGKLKGKSGQFNFRIQDDKNIMSLRPEKVNVSQTPQAKRARKDFAVAVKFSKTVNSVPALKVIWTQAKIEATNSYQKLMKINLNGIRNTSATLLNKITPDGLLLILSAVSIQNNKLNLNFSIPSPENIQFPAGIYIILYLDNFNKSVFMVQSEIDELSADNSYHKSVSLADDIINGLKVDPDPIIYLAVVGSVSNKRKKYWTITEARKL